MNQSKEAQATYQKAKRYLNKYFGDTDHYDYLHDAFLVWYDKTDGKENLYERPVGTVIRVIKNLILKTWEKDFSYMKDGENLTRQIYSVVLGEPTHDRSYYQSRVTPYEVVVADDLREAVVKKYSDKQLLKNKIFAYFAEGYSVMKVCEATNLDSATVRSYLSQYRKNGNKNDYLYVFDKLLEGYSLVDIAEQLSVTPPYVGWLVGNIRETVSKML